MWITPAAKERLIKSFEGFSSVSYPDPGSGGAPWTIGWGHTKGVKPHQTCTKEQAEEWLDDDIHEVESFLNSEFGGDLTQNQFDAVGSFVFNLGQRKFTTLQNGNATSIFRALKAKDFEKAAGEFEKWVCASGKKLPGLVRRRAAEAKWFKEGG